MSKLDGKAFVWNFIEHLAEIKENGVYLECQDELALTGSSLPKSMLLVRQDVISLNVLHYLAVQDVFHDLAAY